MSEIWSCWHYYWDDDTGQWVGVGEGEAPPVRSDDGCWLRAVAPIPPGLWAGVEDDYRYTAPPDHVDFTAPCEVRETITFDGPALSPDAYRWIPDGDT